MPSEFSAKTMKVFSKLDFLSVGCKQTWNLSKNLHRRILSLKILHRQFHLISTVLVGKNTKNEWKWRNLLRWQKFYTAAGTDGMDKFHLWQLGWPKPSKFQMHITNPHLDLRVSPFWHVQVMGHKLNTITSKNIVVNDGKVQTIASVLITCVQKASVLHHFKTRPSPSHGRKNLTIVQV